MTKKLFPTLIVGLLFTVTPFCTNAHNNAVQITHRSKDGSTVTVTAVTPNIIKVENSWVGARERLEGKYTGSTLKIAQTDETIESLRGTMLSTPAGVTVTIDEKNGGVNISAPCMSITDTGSRLVDDGKQQISLYVGKEGSFYGAGERGHSFNLRGDTLVMYNRQNYGYTAGDPRISQMNITMPLFLSSEGYAIVFDDYSPATMILSDPVVYTTEATAPISYYVVYGNGSLPETSRLLSEVTGRQDLPPLWSLGYITSKYGYHDQQETLGVIDTLKTKGYPVDGIVLDLYWYGKEEDMGRLAWDPEQWPSPVEMLDSLKRSGVNLVAISQPYVLQNGRGLDNYNYLSENGMLAVDSAGNTHPVTIWVGEGGMLDVSNPATVEWLRNKYKELTDMGVTGWWGDLGEPEVHPETAFHNNGLSARDYHNRYGNDWSRIIYELFTEEYPETRLMTLMRGGTSGLQQYSVFPWSTDVSRSWGGLQPQVVIMLNSGLSGMGYMSHDVGGFAIDPENPVDEELYVRWLQLGLFSPVLRTHAQQTAEPYLYPDVQDIVLPLIRERYKWLPYNYTLAYENALNGTPLVRPIEYYSGSSASDTITDEYLWGRDVLVAPVLTQGTIARDIRFPEGNDRWIDYNNPLHSYAGGSTLRDYPAPLHVLPLFVRAGAFIPSAPYPMENTGDYRTDTYRVDYYPLDGTDSEYTLYEDDLKSPSAIKNNEYLALNFEGRDVNGVITVTLSSSGSYPGMAETKNIELVVHGLTAAPAEVRDNGVKATFNYDAENASLTLPVKFTVGREQVISIKR